MANETAVQESQEIEVRPRGLALSGMDIDPLAIIEQRNRMLERILEYAIRATNSTQWTDQQGQPFPTAAAAEVMARRCAVTITHRGLPEKIPSQDDKGPFYFYVVQGTASLPGEWDAIDAIGTASSRDSFLGTETREGRPLSEISEGNILKKAYSNMIVNAVTRLLGVRKLTWEKLEDLGVLQKDASRVDYQNGAKGGGQGKSSTDVDIKFGRAKGKKLSELSDDDVRWYLGCWEKDLADPDKEKFHANSKRCIEIAQALLAGHANTKAGTAPAATPAAVTPWARIRALDPTIPDGELREMVKEVTRKTKPSELVEGDIGLMAQAVAARKQRMNDDVPF